ncbi:zinc finger matrin-type protein CG9776 isoform X4 [Tribolium castaneum]
MKAIHNVIEMLSSIIKDGSKISDLEAQLDESPKTHHKNHVKSDSVDPAIKYNYMHYDPELHWCRMCDEFPKTAKDFLLHLQSDKHRNNIQENDVGDNTPWHKLPPEPELPCYEGAPKKRIPIRGLQFFISAPAWYCKLCDTWIGDLHCASHHLKSQAHFQNYANFVEQNPHWEIEWLKDREKAMARNERRGRSSDSDSDKKKKKHRNKRSSMESSSKDKKKKKRSKKRRKHSSDTSSSSSSSDSSSEEEENNDKSKSIRVVMRNMKVQSIMNEDLSGKWEMLERLVDQHKKKEEMQKSKEAQKREQPEDNLINQWMTVSEPQEKEKVLLDNLKDRMKQKQELERAKYAEMEKKQREKEREERELKERKSREEQEAKERYERERRERDREEYERIRDKDRNQVRFKPKDRENYRKRKTPSPSPERPPEKPPQPPQQRQSKERRETPSKEETRERKNSRENGRESQERPRSRSRSEERRQNESKKPSGPPTKRLPFIGRMPLFKNKKVEEKVEKEIKKEDYDLPRVTRFQPGNLARAFLPQPDVVCFPKLSSYPPISAPPPPSVSQPDPPAPPKISEDKPPKAPPAPKIGSSEIDDKKSPEKEEEMYEDPSQMMMNQYYSDYSAMYSQMYDYSQCQEEPPQPPPPDDIPLAHTMPLQPPPLPPNDPSEDLAMLGISADDMAAQSF